MDTNPKTRFGALKPDLSLVPPASIIYQALAMQDGRDKYGAYNWRHNEVSARTYISAAKRHLDQYLDGEDIDPKSNYPHLGHALACIGILIDALETGNLVDDRPPAGCAAALIEKWTKKEEFVTDVTKEQEIIKDADQGVIFSKPRVIATYTLTPQAREGLKAELERVARIEARVKENEAAQLELDLVPFRHVPRS